jgi:hypothetical protein
LLLFKKPENEHPSAPPESPAARMSEDIILAEAQGVSVLRSDTQTGLHWYECKDVINRFWSSFLIDIKKDGFKHPNQVL